MLAHSHLLVKTECLMRQWASGCSGKHGFGPHKVIVCCRHVDCHSIGMMMGCLQQNHGNKQPFTFSIEWISSSLLTLTCEQEWWNQTTLLLQYRGGLLPCRRNVVCFCHSSIDRFAPNCMWRHTWRHVVAKNMFFDRKERALVKSLSSFSEIR